MKYFLIPFSIILILTSFSFYNGHKKKSYKKSKSTYSSNVCVQKFTNTISFFIVAKPGFIVNQCGSLVYFCQDGKAGDIDRFIYDVTLNNGTYAYYNMDKSDTTTFAIDRTGAYKLGFYEDHPSFTIHKEDPFLSK